MRAKIFSAHVRQPKFQSMHDVFIPIWAGGRLASADEWIIDDKIPSISNVIYNDMSHQYYVHKHLLTDLDYVGFEHYRRLFPFPSLLGSDTPLLNSALTWQLATGDWHATVPKHVFDELISSRVNATSEQMLDLMTYIQRYDVILSQPAIMKGLRDQWASACLEDRIYEILIRSISRSQFYMEAPFDLETDITMGYFCNLYVMKTSLFQEYIGVWQDVMFALSNYMGNQMARMPAFLSERLFSIYINEKKKRSDLIITELPFVWCPEA